MPSRPRASDYGLALLSGSRFSFDGTLGGWLRFPFTAPVPTLGRALNLLRPAVAALEPKPTLCVLGVVRLARARCPYTPASIPVSGHPCRHVAGL